jgi:ABC-2 type transport system permease protein
VSGDLAGQVPRVLGAALAQLPAVWVLAGVAVALFGLLPRLSSLAWAGYGAVLFITLIGALLRLGQWFNGISPFNHLPNLPGGEAAITPFVALTGIGALLVASGVIGLGRRDIG